MCRRHSPQVLKRFVFFLFFLEAFGCRCCERHAVPLSMMMTQEEEEEEEARETEKGRKTFLLINHLFIISVVTGYSSTKEPSGTNIECIEQPDDGHDFHESEIQDFRRTYPTMQVDRPNIQHYIQCSFRYVLSVCVCMCERVIYHIRQKMRKLYTDVRASLILSLFHDDVQPIYYMCTYFAK